jgi:DNA-binding transcriptional ArsR family regulator
VDALVADALTSLDGLLFEDRTWYCLDAANQRVHHQRPSTLEQAQALVGRGRVATFAGQLRPHVLAVDIDLPAKLGAFLLEELRAWCRARGLWHLARLSGGGVGHAHLFVVPGVHREAFIEHVKAHRVERRLKKAKLDLRTGDLLLRPLSAPHRKGATARLSADLAGQALMTLREVMDLMPASPARAAGDAGGRGTSRTRRAAPHLTPKRALELPGAPLQPIARSRRDLPKRWQVFFSEGPGAPGGPEATEDRSEMELKATFQLIITGHDESAAWSRIQQAHPQAFAKSLSRGRCWWWLLWNKAVVSADAWLSVRRSAGQRTGEVAAMGPAAHAVPSVQQQAREDLRSVLLGAHAALMDLWLDWPLQTRHTDRELFEVLLDRMSRKGSVSIPVPQRDLVLDCAVASRHTVRKSLDRLEQCGLVVVERTYQAGTTDSSHTVSLGGAAKRPGLEGEGRGLSRVAPPWFHTPLAIRRSLRLPTTHLLLVLRSSPTPRSLPALARAAGLVLLSPSQQAAAEEPELTPAQRRTVARHLSRLLEHDLAVAQGDGQWVASSTGVSLGGLRGSTASQPVPAAVAALQARGEQQQEALRAAVAVERAEFRARLDRDSRRLRWQAARQVVLARQEKLAITRRKAWWNGLSSDEREQRRVVCSDAFRALPAAEQHQRRQLLAGRRGSSILSTTTGRGEDLVRSMATGPMLSPRADQVLRRWSASGSSTPRSQIAPATVTPDADFVVRDSTTSNPVARQHRTGELSRQDLPVHHPSRGGDTGATVQAVVPDLVESGAASAASRLALDVEPGEFELGLDLRLDLLRAPTERYRDSFTGGFVAP